MEKYLAKLFHCSYSCGIIDSKGPRFEYPVISKMNYYKN